MTQSAPQIVVFCQKCNTRYQCDGYEMSGRLNWDCPQCGQLVAWQRKKGDRRVV